MSNPLREYKQQQAAHKTPTTPKTRIDTEGLAFPKAPKPKADKVLQRTAKLKPVSEKRQKIDQPAKDRAYFIAKKRDAKLCQYCAVLFGKKYKATECDHIVKQSRSKADAANPDNLIASCHHCNFWRRERGDVTAAVVLGKQESKQVIAGNGKKAVREVSGAMATAWRVTTETTQ
jgi:hypothetical protein